MKNKKGFTLVELMAVIIIISLIAILTFPNIINQIKKSKQATTNNINDIVISAAKRYVADNPDNFEDDGYCLSVDTLVDNDYIKEDIAGINSFKDNNVVMLTYDDKLNYKIVDKDKCDISEYQRTFVDNEGNKYTRVEYLESTGTQYIDTGIKLNQNSRVKIKYQYSAGARVARVFGDASNASNGWVLTTGDGSINSKIQTLYGSTWAPLSREPQNIIPTTDIIEFERKGVNQYVNGNLYYSNSNTTFETNSTAIVFGAYYNSLALSSIKLYELWIWEDGTNISRHFQPCYRKSDNKPGLYDTVTKEFYTNQGTGEFSYPIDEKYNRVEFLKSTGTQYIDTGIKLNQNSRVKIKYQYSAGAAATARVFGDAHDISNGWVLSTQNGSINAKIQTLYGDSWKPQSNDSQNVIPLTDIVEFERNGVNQYVNGNLYYTNLNSNFETTSTAIVFGAYYNSLSLSSVKVFELLIWEDGTNISRHFIPCYRKSDNKPGLCDTVTKKIFTNQGTGEFLYG